MRIDPNQRSTPMHHTMQTHQTHQTSSHVEPGPTMHQSADKAVSAAKRSFYSYSTDVHTNGNIGRIAEGILNS